MKELDEIKTIAFERWLINNYPEREDNPDYACRACDGTGIADSDQPVQAEQYCFECFGTGSKMYDEYEKQCGIDQERLRDFLITKK